MLNFKKEYFKLEENRQQYATSFSDLMTSCEVYGKKQNLITSTAFIFLIPKDYYTYNAGNIDFTNYPDGIWNDYTDIKIVKSEPYFDLDFSFNSTGDITPENLNQQFENLKSGMLVIQKNIVETQIFMDSGIPIQLGLPLLPKGCVWYREEETGDIVALPVDKMYEKFEDLINTLKKILELYKDDLAQELRTKTDSLLRELETLKGQITETITKLEEQCITDIGVEGNKQVARVTNEGNTQVQNITNEGTKQVEAVKAEGEKQLEIITGAGGGLAPRVEELEKNKQDKTDNNLKTTSKNIVGAINELNDRQPDLTPYQTKTDTSLQTTSKEIVGAINGLNSGKLNSSGNGTLTGNFTVTGSFVSNGEVTAYSDRRLKTDIVKIDNALEKVNQINGYTFTMLGTGKRQAGVIAQELEKVLPEVIVQNQDNGYLTVMYGHIVALLIEAIKELNKEVKELKGGKV